MHFPGSFPLSMPVDALLTEPVVVPEEFLAEEVPRPAPSPPSPVVPPVRPKLAPHPRRARAAPLLPSAPALFPWLARRFAPGEATVWTGPSAAVEPVLELLYAGSAVARGRISLLEGANRFHPYRIGELGRALGIDATETLRRIRLARAFTAYQMVALVDGWAREVRRRPPTLLIGHDLPALFADVEIPDEERFALLGHVARTLAALARDVRLPLLLTLDPAGFERFRALAEEGPPWSDLVTFARGPGVLRLRALRDDARVALVPRPAGQTGMEEFGGEFAEEVIAWGALPRRTAKRSRSG